MRSKKGKGQREMLYNTCIIHLAPDGAAITIDNPSALPALSYHQAVLNMLNTLGLGVKYAHDLLPEQTKSVGSDAFSFSHMRYAEMDIYVLL
jgi:hypothetical protein